MKNFIRLKFNSTTLLVFAVFFLISVAVLYKIIFSDALIGRSLDSTVPPFTSLLPNVLKANFYTWSSVVNAGLRNNFSATLIPVNSILYFPIIFKVTPWFIARYQLIISLVIAMFSFYLLGQKLLEGFDLKKKQATIIAFLGALFFVFNNYFFCELIFGSSVMYLTFAFMPLFIYAVISYLKNQRFQYFFLTIISLIIISSTLQHFIMAYVFLIVLSLVYRNYKFIFKIVFWHILLSLYWILPLLSTASQLQTLELARDYTNGLTNSASYFVSTLINRDYFGNRNLYNISLGNKWLVAVWLMNAFVLLGISLVSLFNVDKFKGINRRLIWGFAVVFILSLLFIKGGREPFGLFVLTLYKNFPLLNVYRTLQHFIGFYVIAISILFIYSAYYLIIVKQKAWYFLAVFVILNAMPWLSGDLGRKNIIEDGRMPSYFGLYRLTAGNYELYNLNQQLLDFSLITIPPGYSVDYLSNEKNSVKSQGGDSGLGFGDKSFYGSEFYSPINKLTDSLERKMYLQEDFFNLNQVLFGYLNIKYFILREDIKPVSSKNYALFNLERINKAIDKSQIFDSKKTVDYVTIMENKNYLPILYTPSKIVYSTGGMDLVPEIINDNNLPLRSSVILKENNEAEFQNIKNTFGENLSNLPIIEYKLINPTKYRVVIHKAKSTFPLVFSQSFNTGWRAYISDYKLMSSDQLLNKVDDYQILTGEEKNQANKEELINYINTGLINSLGNSRIKTRDYYSFDNGREKISRTDEYSVDFISKNFQGTIQNENLTNGAFYENWQKNELSVNHFVANSFANGWEIDPQKICQQNSTKCVTNADGTQDFEITLEFKPQKFFHIGLVASSLVLFTLIIYYVFISFRSLRIKKDGQIV